jgi:hypothetical protein
METLVFKVSREVMVKFHQIPDLGQKVKSAQTSRFSKPVEFPTAVTHKSPTVWSRLMDHQKAERVAYRNSMWDFQSFGQSEIQKLSSFSAAILSGTYFSSIVDA